MPRTIHTGSFLGIFSLALAILAILFEPSRELLRQQAARFGLIYIPDILTSSKPDIVVAHDTLRDIKYVGTSRAGGVEHFQNIFYAEDTSGRNRFAPPVKVSPPPGTVVDASSAGAWCPQGRGDVLPFTSRVANVSEDCLSLRVARSRGTKADAGLPVVVYLHGGGHALGSGSDILYEPDGLVRRAASDGKPVIWVAINYRLGFFGFATSQALVDAKHTNAGLRDQRAALEWVRDNIAAFGGDPARVTVIGQSVGACDIGLQLLAYGGKETVPFARAVMMSGGPGLNFNTNADLVKNNTASVAELVDCVKHGDSQSAATLACLREVPGDKLTELSVAAMRAARPPFGEGYFYPTRDGDFLLDRPSELLRAGKVTKGVPLIASWATNDGAWYAPPTTSTDEEVVATFSLWLFHLSASTKARLLELYPVSDFTDMVRPEIDGSISPQYYRAAQINKDIWFTCPVLDFTWNYAKHGTGGLNLSSSSSFSDIWIYEHNATRFGPAFEQMGVPMWRVAHLSDVPYVLDNQVIADDSPEQLELSRIVSRDILEFVTSSSSSSSSEDSSSSTWPSAFGDLTLSKKDLTAEFPSKLTLQLFGGPHGSGPVTVSKDGHDDEAVSEAQAAVYRERLFERCEFINSAKFREEAGV